MASYVWIVWCQYYYGTVLPTHGIYRILLCTLTHEQIWAYAAISTQWQMQLPGLVFYFFLLFLSSVPCTINIRKTKHKSHILRTTCFFFFTVYFNYVCTFLTILKSLTKCQQCIFFTPVHLKWKPTSCSIYNFPDVRKITYYATNIIKFHSKQDSYPLSDKLSLYVEKS